MKTTWYLHSHVVWLKAWYSSIGRVPLVCVAAHGGNPLMDCRIRQTATASPAEPGGLSLTLVAYHAHGGGDLELQPRHVRVNRAEEMQLLVLVGLPDFVTKPRN